MVRHRDTPYPENADLRRTVAELIAHEYLERDVATTETRLGWDGQHAADAAEERQNLTNYLESGRERLAQAVVSRG